MSERTRWKSVPRPAAGRVRDVLRMKPGLQSSASWCTGSASRRT